MAGVIGRFLEGIEVNNDTLALDLVNEIGPIPGFYLNTEHTRKYWEKDQFIPKAADLLPYGQWEKQGKKSALDNAKELMEEILQTHNPVPLTDEQEREIQKILDKARKYYEENGLI